MGSQEGGRATARLGFVNTQGWGLGKWQLVTHEMKEAGVEIMGVAETQLRENEVKDSLEFKLITKGRRVQKRKGGGTGLIVRKGQGWDIEIVEMGDSPMGEDILVAKLERQEGATRQAIVVMVVYLTVEGHEWTERENQEKLRIIRAMVRRFKEEEIIVMGDFNGHIGILGEEVNGNGRLTLDLMEEAHLENLNITIGEGRVTRKSGGVESAIDFVLVNKNAREKVVSLVVDEEKEIDVGSDHRVLVLEYRLGEPKVKNTDDKKRVNWRLKSACWEEYRCALQEEVWDWGEAVTVEVMNERLVGNITRTAEKKIGKSKQVNSKQKPKTWWNNELKVAWKEKKEANRNSRQVRNAAKQGINVTEGEIAEAEGKRRQSKDRLTYLIKEAIRRDEKQKVEELIGKGEEGGREWYKFLNGGKYAGDEGIEEMIIKGERVKGVKSIRENIKLFWEEIGRLEEGEEQRAGVDLSLMRFKWDGTEDEVFTTEEISKVIGKLKRGKAPGPDGIPYELIKEGGEVLLEVARSLFRNIFREELVPKSWADSRVTLLHKGGHKSKKDLKNYRPIALTNTWGKVFCNLLYGKMSGVAEKMGILGENQNGFRKDRRGSDNLFILGEIIEKSLKDREKVYLAFLDIEKAYDRVNRGILWELLEHLGFGSKAVNILKSLYQNTRAKFSLGNIETDWVESKKGVRQGCILSPLLFSFYTEELAARIREARLGLELNVEGYGRQVLGILLYADDIVLIAGSNEVLQKMLNITSKYGQDFGVRFSREKSGVMVINGQEVEEGWKLSGGDLPRVENYKYLGVMLNEKGMAKAKKEKALMGRQWWGRLASICKFRANSYEVVRGLWKSVAVPSIMYGIEAIGFTKRDIAELDRIQNRVGRLGLGANRFVAVEAIRGEMGWSSFEERMAKAKLKYRIRLHTMEECRWAKRAFKWSKGKSAWGRDLKRVVQQFGTAETLGIGVERVRGMGRVRGILGGDNEGRKNSLRREWKGRIDKRVRKVGLQKWQEGAAHKQTLALYKRKTFPRRELAYDGSWGSKLLCKARTGSLELRSRVGMWNGDGTTLCGKCEGNHEETLSHFMLQCPHYGNERQGFLEMVRELVGGEEWTNTEEMEEDRLAMILGLGKEGSERVLGATKEFLVRMWAKRSLS